MRTMLVAVGVVCGCLAEDPAADETGGSESGDGSSESTTTSTASTESSTSSSSEGSEATTEGSESTGEPEPTFDVMPFSDEVWTWDQTMDACSYSNMGNPFWDWQVIGREPVDAGQYPVFIYLHGTGDVADTPVAVGIVESMAARGFVAASVAYDSLSGLGATLDDPQQTCPILAKKGDCTFGAGEGSAITRLCARERADCERGIVLAGHSQGAAMAIAANDHDDRVRAVYGLSAGLHLDLTIDLGGIPLVVAGDASACLVPDARALPADRLRVVDGESEYAFGDHLQQDVRDLTEHDCELDTLECLRANGSGWTFFPDAANEDGRGVSQHCYMANMPEGDCTASTGLNSTWTDGTESYAREPSLTWLRSFVDP